MLHKRYLVCLAGVTGVLFGVAPRLGLWGVARLVLWLHPLPQYSHSQVMKEGGGPVRCIRERVINWAENVDIGEVTVFYPVTVEGVQNVVKKAKKEGVGVRAVGAKGTWNSWMWLDSPRYLISLVPRGVADRWYRIRPEVEEWLRKPGPLANVQGVISTREEGGKQVAAVKVGAGTLVHQLLNWGAETGWSLGSNVVIERATVGGVVATMSHGAGQGWPSVADYVLGIEFVDVAGERRTLSEKKEVATFVSSFGLMGVTVHFVLKMERIRLTKWSEPRTVSMDWVLPRPGTPLNRDVENLLKEAHFQQFTKVFRSRSLTFLKVWRASDDISHNTSTSLTRLFTEESEVDLTLLFTLGVAVQDLLLSINRKLPIFYPSSRFLYWIVDLAAELFNVMTPHHEKVVTTLDAMNPFRSMCVKKFRVFEFEFPIFHKSGILDWTVVQDAVWDVLDIADKFRSHGMDALDDHLDVRLMSSSSIPLSSFYSNTSSSSTPVWGWAGIAVASTPWVEEELWQRFQYEVVSKWIKYKSPEGKEIFPRPHWGKEMPSFVGQDKEDIYEYLRRAYRDELEDLEPHLHELLKNISTTNLSEALAVFGTQHHHKLFKHFKR